MSREGRRSRADSWILSSCLTEIASLCHWNRTLWLLTSERWQNALWTAHTLCCINTHGHGSSKHTHTALGSEHSLLCISRLFSIQRASDFSLKKKKKEKKTKRRSHLNCRREMCYALQMVNEITFIIKTQIFYSLHWGEEVCRIHKQGLIKHDFQRPHGERGALRGQTQMFCREECATLSCLLYTTAYSIPNSHSNSFGSSMVISATGAVWIGDQQTGGHNQAIPRPSLPRLWGEVPALPKSPQHPSCVKRSVLLSCSHRVKVKGRGFRPVRCHWTRSNTL